MRQPTNQPINQQPTNKSTNQELGSSSTWDDACAWTYSFAALYAAWLSGAGTLLAHSEPTKAAPLPPNRNYYEYTYSCVTAPRSQPATCDGVFFFFTKTAAVSFHSKYIQYYGTVVLVHATVVMCRQQKQNQENGYGFEGFVEEVGD